MQDLEILKVLCTLRCAAAPYGNMHVLSLLSASNRRECQYCVQGYVPGFDGVLGHECVARVVECSSKPELVGKHLGCAPQAACWQDYALLYRMRSQAGAIPG